MQVLSAPYYIECQPREPKGRAELALYFLTTAYLVITSYTTVHFNELLAITTGIRQQQTVYI